MSDIRWLDMKKVIALHGWQMREHGGSYGIRDSGLYDITQIFLSYSTKFTCQVMRINFDCKKHL